MMKTLALVFESEGFFINCILWIVNNYSKNNFIEGKEI